MATTHIRSMHNRDLPAVYRLEKACQPIAWPYWYFRRALASSSCWVVEKNSEIIGFGILRMEKSHAHIMNICVAPEHQHQGLGKRIMLHLLSVAKKMHARDSWLEVRSTNRIAIILYRKLGYRSISIRKNYYPMRRGRQNAIIMARKL
jgi:ribosomal-protein-alanine N-acetyltransferase